MPQKRGAPVPLEKLEEALPSSTESLRPILTNLNDDNAWLLSCPRPLSERRETGRFYYHVALDPWLTNDGAIVIFPWFMNMKRKTEAKVASADALGAVVDRIESIAAQRDSKGDAAKSVKGHNVDAIFVTNENSDHCHKQSLLGFSSETPVFASSKATQKINGWKHFKTVVTTKAYDPAKESWQAAHTGAPLPKWITLVDIAGHTVAAFGLGIILSSQPSRGDAGLHELILLIPHGLLPDQSHIENLTKAASPPIKTLAIMHPLKESWTLGMKVYLGATNALAIARQAHAPYYLKTADSLLDYSGIWAYSQKEKAMTYQSALEEKTKMDAADGHHELALLEVDSGKCLVLS